MDTVELSRLMAHVDITDDCWIWNSTTDDRGYGRFYDKRVKKTRRSHQLMFEAMNGFQAEEILHSCDNPSCVKPTHLSAGTHISNMRDMAKKGRGNTAKLTAEDVRAIRSEWKPGVRGMAKRYGVSRHTIRQIALGETWKDVK